MKGRKGNAESDNPKHMGWGLFELDDLPQATRQSKTLLITVQNLADGVGDFMHALHFSEKIAPMIRAKGYEIYMLVYADQADKLHGKKKVVFMQGELEKSGEFVDDFCIIKNFSDGLDAKITEKLQGFAGQLSIAVSLPPELQSLITKALPRSKRKRLITHIPQYGDVDTQAFSLSNIIAMGLPGEDGQPSYGIALEPAEPPLQQRQQLLQDIASREPQFVYHLLQASSTDKAVVDEYFSSHAFYPGYIQSRRYATAFVAAMVEKEQNSDKRVDILLTEGVVDREAIIETLKACGAIEHDHEVAFINGNSELKHGSDAKVRIFMHRIKNNHDYDNLYRLSSDVAGCSGDNSASLVIGSYHLPFFQKKHGPIGAFFYQLASMCEWVGESTQQYPQGFESLQRYFELLKTISDLSNEENPTQFVAIVKEISGLLQNEQTQQAWLLVRDEIVANYNVHDRLPNIVAANMLRNIYGDKHIVQMYMQTDEVQRYLEHSVFTQENVEGLKSQQLESFSHAPACYVYYPWQSFYDFEEAFSKDSDSVSYVRSLLNDSMESLEGIVETPEQAAQFMKFLDAAQTEFPEHSDLVENLRTKMRTMGYDVSSKTHLSSHGVFSQFKPQDQEVPVHKKPGLGGDK